MVVRNAYCTSEAGAVTFNDGDDLDAVRSSSGRPLPGVEVRTERPVDGQEASEIVVGGPLVAEGYRHPDGRFEPFAGPVRTGDDGWLDRAGRLHVWGRLDGRINVGAHTIDPAAVEDHLRTHPGVADCAVVPQAHPRLGAVPVARVVPSDGWKPSDRELIAHCRAGLAAPSVPRAVDWVDAVPRTATGKVVRRREV
jgi:acyl-coenzyme A synthetase/AMP-(fatty) acid ligase